jgi:hypothetical protein
MSKPGQPLQGMPAKLRQQRRPGVLVLLTVVLLGGCSDSRNSEAIATVPGQPEATVTKAAVKVTADARNALCENVRVLEEQVAQLLQSPAPQHLQDAREAWRAAHESWRIWRLLQRVADHGHPPAPANRIDAQPILPGYLDRVPGYPASGLVFSEVPLDPEALAQAHQSTDLYYGVLGFHPLEFMLWGVPNAEGEPTRKAEAFRDQAGDSPDTIPAPARRRTLAASMVALLSLDLADTCPLTTQPRWLSTLAEQLDENIRRRHTMIWWLETLTGQLNAWQQNPQGEDRNGMPLWHSAFARTDFAEIDAELAWLLAHQWPRRLEREAAEPLRVALQALDENPPHTDGARTRLASASAAAADLIKALLTPTPEERSSS